MKLRYDPGENETFWQAVRRIPGFPQDDEIRLRTMIFESNAIFRLPDILRSFSASAQPPLLAVMDPTPMQRGAESLKPLVLKILSEAGLQVESLLLEPDGSGQVHTDMPHIEAVRARLSPGKTVLSVGSGVVTDISKHACYLYQQATGQSLPFVVFPTANSVSAYASNMAPVFIDGVKRTLPSRYPDALVCDLETLVDAPREMTVAGVGDMLAIYTSFADWYLAHRLGMDTQYTRLPQALLENMFALLEDCAGEIRRPTPGGMALLAKLITLGGLAMSLSHATTPLSGYEHVVSHILDLINELRQAPLAQHGSQVAVATVLLSEVYQDFLEAFQPAQVDLERCFPEVKHMQWMVKENFLSIDPSGKAGEECWRDYRIKLADWHARRESLGAFLDQWPEIRGELERLTCPPERLVDLLRKIDAPTCFAGLTPAFEESEVQFAFLNAPLMRKRLTLGDLLVFFECDRQSLWERAWGKTQVIAD
jgi:glycerol-1-phosphate dehydrogenase [NAD(P)+]